MAHTTSPSWLQPRDWGVLEWSIASSVGLSLLVWVSQLIFPWLGLPASTLGRSLECLPDMYWVVRRPWSLLTYALVHSSLLHLVVNMLVLWVVGRRFVELLGVRRFVPLYLMSALSGSLLYLVGYGLLDLLGWSPLPLGLVGSSAVIMALLFALALYLPHRRIPTPLGARSYLQIAAILLGVQLLLMWDNLGGQLAHIGGALMGAAFGYSLQAHGRDLGEPISRAIDRLLRFVSSRRSTSPSRRSRPRPSKQEAEELRQILEKLKQSGYTSLSTDEKRQLLSHHDQSPQD